MCADRSPCKGGPVCVRLSFISDITSRIKRGAAVPGTIVRTVRIGTHSVTADDRGVTITGFPPEPRMIRTHAFRLVETLEFVSTHVVPRE